MKFWPTSGRCDLCATETAGKRWMGAVSVEHDTWSVECLEGQLGRRIANVSLEIGTISWQMGGKSGKLIVRPDVHSWLFQSGIRCTNVHRLPSYTDNARRVEDCTSTLELCLGFNRVKPGLALFSCIFDSTTLFKLLQSLSCLDLNLCALYKPKISFGTA